MENLDKIDHVVLNAGILNYPNVCSFDNGQGRALIL